MPPTLVALGRQPLGAVTLLSDSHIENIPLISVALGALMLDRSKLFSDEQSRNSPVSQRQLFIGLLGSFTLSSELHPAKQYFRSSVFERSQLERSTVFRDLHPAKMPASKPGPAYP